MPFSTKPDNHLSRGSFALLKGMIMFLFRAVVPASLAGIAAVWPDLDIGILALCTDRLIMLHTYGLRFLIHED